MSFLVSSSVGPLGRLFQLLDMLNVYLVYAVSLKNRIFIRETGMFTAESLK